jgi:hypothetical protein
LHYNLAKNIFNVFGGMCQQVPMVQTFIGNKGGMKDFALSFILGGDYLTFKFDANIKLLDIKRGFLIYRCHGLF